MCVCDEGHLAHLAFKSNNREDHSWLRVARLITTWDISEQHGEAALTKDPRYAKRKYNIQEQKQSNNGNTTVAKRICCFVLLYNNLSLSDLFYLSFSSCSSLPLVGKGPVGSQLRFASPTRCTRPRYRHALL